ncbi:hypothetical protein ONZ45_g7256 [Pleurotus djamor]|nr:hypothetical protein ONZ45_g7256 [Pleurotus djamor]
MPLLRPARLFDVEEGRFVKPEDISKDFRYAILSHRWEDPELNYKQLSRGFPASLVRGTKFEHFCKEASGKYDCRYVWMDSVCINREDTDELTDAIQSMYWYYRHAEVCIVYLADAFDGRSFTLSSWFTRGWTLQELLAPTKLAFYYGDWNRVDRRRKFDIEKVDRFDGKPQQSVDYIIRLVSEVAGIDLKLLYQHYEPSPRNYENVLNWANSRSTSCEEDASYCLISLLNVYLPLHYGEGQSRARVRLGYACNRSVYIHEPLLGPRVGAGMLLHNNPPLCEKHRRGREGNPSILHVFQSDRYTSEQLGLMMPPICVLVTAVPIPKNVKGSVEVLFQQFGPPQLLYYSKSTGREGGPIGELIATEMEVCDDCAFKFFGRVGPLFSGTWSHLKCLPKSLHLM